MLSLAAIPVPVTMEAASNDDGRQQTEVVNAEPRPSGSAPTGTQHNEASRSQMFSSQGFLGHDQPQDYERQEDGSLRSLRESHAIPPSKRRSSSSSNHEAPSYEESLGHQFIATEDGQAQPLPPWWVRKRTHLGTDYYVDHDNELTSWESPVAAESQELSIAVLERAAEDCAALEQAFPHGWKQKWTRDETPFYIHGSVRIWADPLSSLDDARISAGLLNDNCFKSEKPQSWCKNAAGWLELLGWPNVWEHPYKEIGQVIDVLVHTRAVSVLDPGCWRSNISFSELAAIKFQNATWPKGIFPTLHLVSGNGDFAVCEDNEDKETFEAKLEASLPFIADSPKYCNLLAITMLPWFGNDESSLAQAMSAMATLSVTFNLGPRIACTALRIMRGTNSTFAPIEGLYDDVLLLRSKTEVCMIFKGFYHYDQLPSGQSTICKLALRRCRNPDRDRFCTRHEANSPLWQRPCKFESHLIRSGLGRPISWLSCCNVGRQASIPAFAKLSIRCCSSLAQMPLECSSGRARIRVRANARRPRTQYRRSLESLGASHVRGQTWSSEC